MPMLSANFTLEEFIRSDTAERLRNNNSPTPAHYRNLVALAAGMERVRATLGHRRITIMSGYRNPVVNRAVGGVTNSAHALGHAADFTVFGLTPLRAAQMLRDSVLRFDQLILESSRNIVHISFDPRMRRDVLTQKGGPGTPFIPGIQ